MSDSRISLEEEAVVPGSGLSPRQDLKGERAALCLHAYL